MNLSNVRKMSKLMLFICCMFVSTNVFCEFLTVDQYVEKVQQSNNNLQDIDYQIEATTKKLHEVYRFYTANLNSDLSYAENHTRAVNTQNTGIFNDQDAKTVNFNISFDKQFQTGTLFSVGYGAADDKIKYLVPEYTVDSMAPYVALEQSLFKNFNGAATKATVSKMRASAESYIYLQIYKKQQILLNAKRVYWTLSYARTVAAFRKNSLVRNKKVLDWNQSRYNKDLAELNDVLQSRASYKIRELNLKQAEYDEVTASRQFNEMINISSNSVEYQIESIENLEKYFQNIKELQNPTGKRADTWATISNAESYMYAERENAKSIGSDLKFVGQVSMNGVDSDISGAFSEVSKLKYPGFTLGLVYNMPLDFSLQKSVKEGFYADTKAAQKQMEQAELIEKNDWTQLLTNWNNTKTKYALAKDIKTIQQQRNTEEQRLLRSGRSTTFQMLQSEQDLDDAILTQYQLSMDLIFIYLESQILYNTQKITLE